MYWYSRIIFLVVILAGCASNQPQIGKKVFMNEDSFIVQGLLEEQNDNISEAINTFNFLYKKTDKYIYFEEVIKLNFDKKDYKNTINLTNQFIKKYPKKEQDVLNYKIYSYIKLKKLNIALNIAQSFLKENRSLEAYKLVAYIYREKKDYKDAIKYLKSAYSISHSPEILAEMGDIFFKYLKNPNEAISYYQTHIRLYGCNEMICNRLADIYRFLYDYNNLIEIYKKIYLNNLNPEYARKIVYLYLELGKYNKAVNFINKHNLDNSLLYLVYKTRLDKTHNYEDAYKLYKYTKQNKYFFQYSIYKFNKSEKGLVNLKNVIANLELLLKRDKKPIYLNYLGYILIDYDVNPKKGIKLVKEALKSNNNSPEFLDSLAWGYYKLKQCKKAYQVSLKIYSDDKEINIHKKLIRRCYDSTKNHSKNKRKFKKR